MDLRPKLAREFATAIYESLADGPADAMEPEEAVEKWSALILERFKSHSIRFNWEGGDGVTRSADEGVVAMFLDKYPPLRPVLEHMAQVAQETFPGCVLQYEVHSDPEGCHICNEGQDVWLNVFYDGPKTEDGKIDFGAVMPVEEQYEDRVMYAEDCPYAQLGHELQSIVGVMVHAWLPDPPEE